MIPFATTKHLILRPLQESDKDSVFSLLNDQRVQHGNNLGQRVPFPDMLWELVRTQALSQLLFLLVVEIKNEFLYMRGDDPNEIEDEQAPEAVRRQRRKFVGGVTLRLAESRNRDTELGISLAFAWWGKGLGTELLQWLLEHNFTQLNMHRMSLGVFGDNDRAIELYNYLGFVEEGRIREGLAHENGWVDFVKMGMLDREWQARKGQMGSTSAFDDVVVATMCKVV
ncbi:acyl-CoA N-acyltransferase [Calocera viscosa TUFC12733]|uniref:Acyl-CoA N-acyltransferase n=1 Tax=Calocera viscosa (strain TUFC12733) TaxID=1330018 RepID=A0A167KH58_CALVF|nr:acyl-CoA N-acyltransferase [Calocera viscosa TUFC12733]